MSVATRHWYRLHSNGWIGMVTLDEDRRFTFGAAPVSDAVVFSGAPDLQSAQNAADQAVDAHACDDRCGRWLEGLPRDAWDRR
jgi:hypothetical protein